MKSTQSKFGRFKDVPWFPEEDIYVLVGGAGGIGSWTSLLLSRAGFNVVVYDHDILDETNMAGQLYPASSVGQPKVVALTKVVRDFSDANIMAMADKITEDTLTNPIVIAAFDNMKARKDMFEKWAATYKNDPNALFIDGRLNAEQMWIFCVTIDKVDRYRKELFDDSEIEDEPCTMKQTSHAAAMIASHITAFLTNHITNVLQKDKIREIPFEWNYFIPMNYWEQNT